MKNKEKKVQIFMVEDNELFAQTTAKALELKIDCKPRIFKSGEDFLKELWRKPDLIILDLNLSVDQGIFDGKQVLEIVNSVQPLIPVIILTSSTKLRTSLELVKGGAIDYITKNDNYFSNLLESIRTILKLKTINLDSKKIKIQKNNLKKRLIIALVFFTAIFCICIFYQNL